MNLSELERRKKWNHTIKFPRSFYLRPTLTVARDLLGRLIVRRYRRKFLIGKIVEVEAYLGDKDPASHAYRNRTQRNDVMFWKGGHLYVYFTYGMHFCANIVTGEEGKGSAVLIRSVEPIDGLDIMARHRKINMTGKKESLTNGPAKFCQAFKIDRMHNGTDLLGSDIFLTDGELVSRSNITATTRIGIANGSRKKWRFYIRGNTFVSKK